MGHFYLRFNVGKLSVNGQATPLKHQNFSCIQWSMKVKGAAGRMAFDLGKSNKTTNHVC